MWCIDFICFVNMYIYMFDLPVPTHKGLGPNMSTSVQRAWECSNIHGCRKLFYCDPLFDWTYVTCKIQSANILLIDHAWCDGDTPLIGSNLPMQGTTIIDWTRCVFTAHTTNDHILHNLKSIVFDSFELQHRFVICCEATAPPRIKHGRHREIIGNANGLCSTFMMIALTLNRQSEQNQLGTEPAADTKKWTGVHRDRRRSVDPWPFKSHVHGGFAPCPNFATCWLHTHDLFWG